MAEALKNIYNPAFFEKICPVLKDTVPGFDCRDFIFRVFNNTWPDLELKARVRHITRVMHYFLPENFNSAARILVDLSQALRQSGVRQQGFETIFIADYIGVYGIDHADTSLEALEEITKLVSAEFAVRPFLLRYPGKTIEKMLMWSKHVDANVRRLSSEGCRPRLPWAMGIPLLKKDPSPILPILENLKADDSEYVRRSVANNLNDIAKDHPQLVLNIVTKWKGNGRHTDWIIKHACRTLLKRGDTHALRFHGFNPNNKAAIVGFAVPKTKVKIGEYLNFNFNFVSHEKKPANFRLEYAIDYITATGKTSRKIFKITENNFLPGKPIAIYRKQSFKNFTTRKHFKGKHYLTILANGKKLIAKEFMVG